FSPFGFGGQRNDHRTFEGEFESADKPVKTASPQIIEIEHRAADDQVKGSDNGPTDSSDADRGNPRSPQNK
ncbi:MAG: hypothetical protein ACRCUL_11445, partial [Plesiomonas sp.]